jgi:hypothetical protein
VEWIIYPDNPPVMSEVRQCMDKGPWAVYAQIPCFIAAGGLEMTDKWLEIWRQLPAQEQARFRWLVYTETREDIVQAKLVIAKIRAGIGR